MVEIGLLGDVDVAAFELNPDSNHGDHDGRENTDEGYFFFGSLGHWDTGPNRGKTERNLQATEI